MGWYSLAVEEDSYFSADGYGDRGHKAEISTSQEDYQGMASTDLVVSRMVEIVGVGVIRMLDRRMPNDLPFFPLCLQLGVVCLKD